MRRLLPYIIVALGLGALAFDILPLPRPFSEPSEPISTRLGLDLQGGVRGEYRALPTENQPITRDVMETIRSVIEQRVNATGVAEPVVQVQGNDRVVVEMPGLTNEEQVRRLIGNTGKLDFVPLPPERYGSNGQGGVADGTNLYAQDPNLKPLFSGDQLDVARPGTDPQSGRPEVVFLLKPEGARLFADFTSKNVGNYFAIVLDGIVQSAPVIKTAITNANSQGVSISGRFTRQEVNNLVTILKFGALPLKIEEVGFSRVSATLGLDFLRQSILAAIIGIGLVFAFMLIHYRLPGAVACLALLYYSMLVYAIFRLIPVTLTLAGVAAFVLSVGMAVDANILIFERTKEELRTGKTIQPAMEAGFNRAWNSILDSNVSSLITAGILFYFGSPTIRGFALVLIIGVLVSMFTAITLSRMMLRWVVRQPWARRARLYGVQQGEFTTVAPRGRTREVGARA